MPYPINRSDGTLLLNLVDQTRDTESTSLTLLGRGSVDYGESVAENFVHLVESFANPTPPANPLPGQTWFHTFDPGPPIKNVQKLKIFNGAEWVAVGGATSSVDPPEGPEPGDLWYNQEDSTIYYWDGFTWKKVGGPYTGLEPGVDPGEIDPHEPIDPPAEPNEGEFWWMLPERKLWAFDESLEAISCFPPGAKRVDGSAVPNGWVLVGPEGIRDPDDPESPTYNLITNITVINPDTGEPEEVPVNIIVINGKIVAVWCETEVLLEQNSINGMDYASWSDPFDAGSSTKLLRPGLNMNHGSNMLLNGQASDSERLNGLNSSQFLRSDQTTYPTTTDAVFDLGTREKHWAKFFAVEIRAGARYPEGHPQFGDLIDPDFNDVNVFGKAKRAELTDAAEKAKAFFNAKALRTGNDSNTVATDNDVYVNFTDLFADPDQNLYYGTAKFTQLGENKIKDIAEDIVETIINQQPAGEYVKTTADTPNIENNKWTVGGPNNRFKEIFATTFNGTATAAQYSDLAERYEADYKYSPGTLLSIGGEKEVTLTSGAYDYAYFGVVSTAPAYLMNNAEEFQNDQFPPIALMGRVPVRVIGQVKKGQRIVLSELQGVARAMTSTVDPAFIVGRALADKTTEEEGLVLCVVAAK